MAPTQVLAEQHMNFFSNLPEKMGFRPVLLKGESGRKNREKIYGGIKSGLYNLVIGTHSLIQKEVTFSRLGLAVIDEQQRFGVRQRALIDKKGDTPHILLMSATPIPRTLAITLYGDMDLSVIKEYPEGHTPVRTYIVKKSQKGKVFKSLKEKLSSGRQAFVICPVIDNSDETGLKSALDMADKLKKLLTPPHRIGIIHGRMTSGEKDKVMADFHKRSLNLLVGTTVIEVGIHAPNATIMIIEHPERFGLSQLHQLRGRVGRGKKEGICLLMLSDNISDKALSRLKIMTETHDGFEIARYDLELRGHGELTGIRQSGAGELDFVDILNNQELLLKARKEAQDLIESDPYLNHPEHIHLKSLMESFSTNLSDI